MAGKSCLAGHSAAFTGHFSSKIKDRPAACVRCSKLQQTTLGNKKSPMPQTLTIQTSCAKGTNFGSYFQVRGPTVPSGVREMAVLPLG